MYTSSITDLVSNSDKLSDEKISLADLKLKIKELAYDKKYLTACNFCNGRDYKTPSIDAAIQTIKPLPYAEQSNI